MLRRLLARLLGSTPPPEYRVPWVIVGPVAPPRGAVAAWQVAEKDGTRTRTWVEWPEEPDEV